MNNIDFTYIMYIILNTCTVDFKVIKIKGNQIVAVDEEGIEHKIIIE